MFSFTARYVFQIVNAVTHRTIFPNIIMLFQNRSIYFFLSDSDPLLSCGRKWDEMLCWPVSSFNQTVAIPCKDSKQFVAIVESSRPSFEVTHIPGKCFQNHFNQYRFHIISMIIEYILDFKHTVIT